MNLTVYNPDEHEEPKGDSPIPEVREEIENIVSFSVVPPDPNYMSVEEVAKILWKTEEEIMIWITKWGALPARDIWGEWRIDREAFERDRSSIDYFFEEDPDEEKGLTVVTTDE